jgi:reactive intermediate/imine deaminase
MKQHLSIAACCVALSACAPNASPPLSTATDTKKSIEIVDLGDNGDYPFSDAARVGNLLFLSGALGIPLGGDAPVPGGIAAETRQAMDNLKLIAAASGYEMKNIVKCNVFLVDMAEWPAFNEVYKTYFSKPYPARIAVGVKELAAHARVEIECIAAK